MCSPPCLETTVTGSPVPRAPRALGCSLYEDGKDRLADDLGAQRSFPSIGTSSGWSGEIGPSPSPTASTCSIWCTLRRRLRPRHLAVRGHGGDACLRLVLRTRGRSRRPLRQSRRSPFVDLPKGADHELCCGSFHSVDRENSTALRRYSVVEVGFAVLTIALGLSSSLCYALGDFFMVKVVRQAAVLTALAWAMTVGLLILLPLALLTEGLPRGSTEWLAVGFAVASGLCELGGLACVFRGLVNRQPLRGRSAGVARRRPRRAGHDRPRRVAPGARPDRPRARRRRRSAGVHRARAEG